MYHYSILVVASIASSAPQINLIRHHGNCTGISLSYLLFNLVVATYNFTLILYAATDGEDTIWFRQPSDAGDWLNIAQFSVAALGHLVL